jgi:hypothetical protein
LALRASWISITAAAAALVLAGCGSGGAKTVTTVTATATVTQTVSVGGNASSAQRPVPITTSPTERPNGIGARYRNVGAVVTITAAHTARSIVLDGRTVNAGAGAKYVILGSKVLNDAKTSFDLTCSYDVANKLVDDQQREFDTIENLYEIPGNPECNHELQPGFSEKMIWIYRVPANAKISGWTFADISDPANMGTDKYTLIPLTVPGS